MHLVPSLSPSCAVSLMRSPVTLGIKPVVDPVSPMLHQLCARSEKREWSVASVEFWSRGTAVDVGQICFGVAPAPSFLRAICSIPSFGIAKFVAIA